MVMTLVRALVSNRLARDLDGLDRAVTEQGADRSVNGRDAQAVDALRGCFEQFIDAKGPLGAFEDFPQGIALFSFPGRLGFHGRILKGA